MLVEHRQLLLQVLPWMRIKGTPAAALLLRPRCFKRADSAFVTLVCFGSIFMGDTSVNRLAGPKSRSPQFWTLQLAAWKARDEHPEGTLLV